MKKILTYWVSVVLIVSSRSALYASPVSTNDYLLLNANIRSLVEGRGNIKLCDAASTNLVSAPETLSAYRYAFSAFKENSKDRIARALLVNSMFLMRRHGSVLFVEPLKEMLECKLPASSLYRKEAAKTLFYITRDKEYAKKVIDGSDDFARAGALEAMATDDPESASSLLALLGDFHKPQECHTLYAMNSIRLMRLMKEKIAVSTNRMETLIGFVPSMLMTPIGGVDGGEFAAEDTPSYIFLLNQLKAEHAVNPDQLKKSLLALAEKNAICKLYVKSILVQLEGGSKTDFFPMVRGVKPAQ